MGLVLFVCVVIDVSQLRLVHEGFPLLLTDSDAFFMIGL